jgi:hypothetical protein
MAKTWQVILATVAIFLAGLVTGGATALGIVRWVVRHPRVNPAQLMPPGPRPGNSPSSSARPAHAQLREAARPHARSAPGLSPIVKARRGPADPRAARGPAHLRARDREDAGRDRRRSDARAARKVRGADRQQRARLQQMKQNALAAQPPPAEIGVARPPGGACSASARRHAWAGARTPPGPEGSNGTDVLPVPWSAWPLHLTFRYHPCPNLAIRSSRANGGRRRSATSSARTMWCARSGTRSPAAGSRTPTCSSAPGARARPRSPGSSPRRSTAPAAPRPTLTRLTPRSSRSPRAATWT